MKRLFSLLLIGIMLMTSLPLGASASVLQTAYEDALLLVVEERYEEAAKAFEKMSGYADASKYALYCAACNAAQNGFYELAITNLTALGDFADSQLLITYFTGCKYETAQEYEKAAEIFASISLYKDSFTRTLTYPDMSSEGQLYTKAKALEEQGQFESALACYQKLGNYRDSQQRAQQLEIKVNEITYQNAVILMEEGKLEQALEIFVKLDNYGDSHSIAQQLKKTIQEKKQEEDYQKALSLETTGEYSQALKMFVALKNYKDSTSRVESLQLLITEQDYQRAVSLEQQGFLSSAYDLYLELKGYRDSVSRAEAIREPAMYEKGLVCIIQEDYDKACTLFEQLGSYRDSVEKVYLLTLNKVAPFITVKKGVAFYHFHDRYGMVDLNNNKMFEPKWTAYKKLDADFFAVQEDNVWFVIDETATVRSKRMKFISSSSGGVCLVRQSNYYGLMKTDGKMLTECKYLKIGDFSEDITFSFALNKNYPVQTNEKKWGLMSGKGEMIIPAQYDDIGSYYDGYYVTKGKQVGIMHADGNTWLPIEYEYIDAYENGFVRVKKNKKWGYCNLKGEQVIPCIYAEAQSFDGNGWAHVKSSDASHWDIIDASGNKVYFVDINNYQLAQEKIRQGEYEEAIKLLEKLGNSWDAAQLLQEYKYEYAQELLEKAKYERAYELLEELNEYKGAAEFADAHRVERAQEYIKAHNYEKALDLYMQLDDTEHRTELIQACRYNWAKEQIELHDYVSAFENLMLLDNYSDSRKLANQIFVENKQELLASLKPGDTIVFGAYEQDNNEANGSEPITWLVLDTTKEHVMMISLSAIDARPYHSSSKKITWADSSIRKWLNDAFYKKAFSDEEQALIRKILVKTPALSKSVTGSKDTKDNVFLLSIEELRRYLKVISSQWPETALDTMTNQREEIKVWLRNSGNMNLSKAAFFHWSNAPMSNAVGADVTTEYYICPVICLSVTAE